MKKRILSLFLSLCMLASLFSGVTFSAFAEETIAPVVEDVPHAFPSGEGGERSETEEVPAQSLPREVREACAAGVNDMPVAYQSRGGTEPQRDRWQSEGLTDEGESFAAPIETAPTEEVPAELQATHTGSCGENLTWTLVTITGKLTISGTGKMTYWDMIYDIPWYSYSSSIKTVSIGNGVTAISDYAFYDCDSLTSITIPDSVTSIGAGAFRTCSSLTSVTIPDSVTSIGENAFTWCDSLTSVTIGNSVTSIGEGAFTWCGSLTSITIPDSVTSIGARAFSYCSSLTSVTIANSVTSVGIYAFSDCHSLTSITVSDGNTVYSSQDGVLFNKAKSTLICYPGGKTGTYTIPTGVTSIGEGAFSGCTSLTSITIPDSVTSIGEQAFSGCDSLTSITIPDSVTSIGDGSFKSCSSLTSVKIPDSVTSIGEYAFSSCTSLTSVTIPDSVTSIGDEAFSACDSLTSITIGNSVTSIGEDAFLKCSSLTSITIPDSVTSIGRYAFYLCTSLTDVYYSGTEAQWKTISIGSYNSPLKNATIHYNYETPVTDPQVIEQNITVIGQGDVCAWFRVYDAAGKLAPNHAVTLTVDMEAPRQLRSNAYGYACVTLPKRTVSRDYYLTLSGDDVRGDLNIFHVTVKPLEFSSSYEGKFSLNASIGAGIEEEATLFGSEAVIGLGGVNVSADLDTALSMKQSFSENKMKLALSATQSSKVGVNANLGISAKWKDKSGHDVVDISAFNIGGKAQCGSWLGVGYEDDDFRINDADDVKAAAKFLLYAAIVGQGGNVVTSYMNSVLWSLIAELPVNTYKFGTSLQLESGAKIGSLSTKGDQSVGVDLYNPYAKAALVYEENYDSTNAASRTSKATTAAGTKLGTISFSGKFMNDDGYGKPESSGVSYSSSLSAYGKADGNSMTIGAKRYAGLQDVSLTVENAKTSDSLLLSKEDIEKTTLTFRGDAAEALAAKNTKLRDFSFGNDYLFNFTDRETIAQELLSAQAQGEVTTKQSHKNSVTIPLTFGAGSVIKFKLGTTLSGSESYEYETSRGVYDNGIAYTSSVSDIREEVEANRLTISGLYNLAAYELAVLVSACWDDTKEFFGDVGDSISAGWASVKNAAAAAAEWTVGILSPKSATQTMQLLALGDRMTLFAAPSVATTVGDPYIVYVEDSNGAEVTNFGDKPLSLSLGYSLEMLDAANVTGEDIAIYHWDDTIGAYRRLGGTVDVQTQTVTTLIYEPGQYILAVDNCSPAITNFAASDVGSAPKLTAVISDMSGLQSLTFGIDGETIISGTDFADYYNRTTGSFVYRTAGLTAGVHTAFLIAEDSAGNRTAEPITLEFTVSTDAPTVGDVTYEKGDRFTATAEVSGSDISLVVLTIEELTDDGAVQSAHVMQSAETGYTVTIPLPAEAFTARVIAYDSNGNAEESESVKQYLIGDVNRDDAVTAKDITMLRRVLVGGYGMTTSKAVADVNNDSTINAKDITALRRHVAGGYGVELP